MDIHNTDPFSIAFDYASGKIGERFQNPLWQITEVFFGKQFKDSVAKVKAFGNVIVANAVKSRNIETSARATISSRGNEAFDEISGSLINSLLASIDDHQTVADAALNYLSAGELVKTAQIRSLSLTNYRKRHNSTSLDMDVLSAHATSGSS